MALFCALVASAQTTQFTGTVKDLTNTPVATGQISFTLQPGADTTISGVARFSPIAVTCSIVNQAISSISRATNVVTVNTSSAHGFTTGDLVNVVGVTDTSYNANGLTITVTSPTQFTYAQTAGNSSSSGGYAGNIFKFGGTGACTLVNNTALTPPGTSYKVSMCPLFACTAQFITFALGGVVDLTTAVPTPATLPTYSFVDTFSNQIVAGNKTFSGVDIFSANGDPTSLILGQFWLSSTNPGRFKWYDGSAIRTAADENSTETLSNKTCTTCTLPSPAITGTPTGSGIPTVTLKKGTGAGDYTTASTTYVDVDATNLALTVTIPTGWKLAISARATALAGAGDFGLSLFDGSTLCEAFQIASTSGTVVLFWAITGDGAPHTVKLQYKNGSAGTATIKNPTATNAPTMLFELMPSN